METKEILQRQNELLKKIDILSEENKLIKILGPQTIFNDYKKELFAIINLPDNKEQMRKFGSVTATAVDCFDYGVIIGKRLLRAKHKRDEDDIVKIVENYFKNGRLDKKKKENIMAICNILTGADDNIKTELEAVKRERDIHKSIIANNLAERNKVLSLIK